MSFNGSQLNTNPRQRVRLLIGDVANIPWLDDSVYNYILTKNSNDELQSAVELLQYVESRIILEPTTYTTGFTSEERPVIEYIANRIKQLKVDLAKRDGTYSPPVVVRSDRKDWKDIEGIFPK